MLRKRLWKRYIDKVYRSIDDLPIYNWFKIQETNDMRYLLKVTTNEADKFTFELAEIWEKIYSEFIDTFGINDTFRQMLMLRKEICVLRMKVAMKDENAYLVTFAEIKEKELKQMIEKLNEKEMSSAKVYVEKYLGFKIDQRVTTVREYYEYIKAIEKEAKNG